MSWAEGMIMGPEGAFAENGFLQNVGPVLATATNRRTTIGGQRGNATSLQNGIGTGVYPAQAVPPSGIAWGEVAFDLSMRYASASNSWEILASTIAGFTVSRSDGTVRLYNKNNRGTTNATPTGSTLKAESWPGVVPALAGRWFTVSGILRLGTNGRLLVRVNQRTYNDFDSGPVRLDGAEVSDTPADAANLLHLTFGATNHMLADVFIRPRCLLVAGGSGAPLFATVTGDTSGATAEVYAWRTRDAGSGGAPGDPRLPVGVTRVFVRNTSFDPGARSGGFVDGEALSGTGMSGSPVVSAPDPDHYVCGLEPGGQLFGPALTLERLPLTGDGAITGEWALGGTATNQADAIDAVPVSAASWPASAASGDRASVALGALANQSSIRRVVGVAVTALGQSDGVDPNAVTLGLLDDGTDVVGPDRLVPSSAGPVKPVMIDTNANGDAWTPGAGAGGLEDAELLLESTVL